MVIAPPGYAGGLVAWPPHIPATNDDKESGALQGFEAKSPIY